MKLTFVLDHRFQETPDGRVWSPGNLGLEYFERYRDVFDEIRVVARLEGVQSRPAGAKLASGTGITFCSLGNFQGAAAYALGRQALRKRLAGYLEPGLRDGAFLLRLPSVISNLAVSYLRAHAKPYAVEVVGDPRDVFGWGRPAGPVGLVLSRVMSDRLRREVRGASAVGYVPSPQLRARYPAGESALVREYSSLALADDDVLMRPRRWEASPSPVRLVTVGSMAWPYKGFDVLLHACRLLHDEGIPLELSIVGDGQLRSKYESLAASLGLASCVSFMGRLPAGGPVYAELDAADVFVLASLTEGLPRALIEAMARGLPCVGTRVGGIPELLDSECLAAAGDASELASAIRRLAANSGALNVASETNLARSQSFRLSEMRVQSRAVYERLAASSVRA